MPRNARPGDFSIRRDRELAVRWVDSFLIFSLIFFTDIPCYV